MSPMTEEPARGRTRTGRLEASVRRRERRPDEPRRSPTDHEGSRTETDAGGRGESRARRPRRTRRTRRRGGGGRGGRGRERRGPTRTPTRTAEAGRAPTASSSRRRRWPACERAPSSRDRRGAAPPPPAAGAADSDADAEAARASAAASPWRRTPRASRRGRSPLWARFLAASLRDRRLDGSGDLDQPAPLSHRHRQGPRRQRRARRLASSSPKPRAASPQTILILGSDKRLGEEGDPGRSDTTILLRVDPDKDAIALLSIPRDLRSTSRLRHRQVQRGIRRRRPEATLRRSSS